MSIFASLNAPSDGEHEDDCAQWVKRGDCWEIGERPCDCGQPRAPFVYQGSHALPSDADERGGDVDIALIPSHITRDGRDDRSEAEGPWPYLRLGVNEGTVILDRSHVEQIVAELTWWLAAVGGDQ